MAGLSELIRSTGIIPADGQEFFLDDNIHRFRIHGEKMMKSSGSYQLTKKPDGRVVGWVRDHRQGLTIPVATKGERPMTEAHKAKLIAEQNAKVAAREAIQLEIAVKARKLYQGGKEHGQHEYATRKGIPVIGARVRGDVILVPLYDSEGKICNVQCINNQGDKRFLTNGKKLGCMGAIPPRQGLGVNKIYVVEGWATGVSVWLATGCAVSIAFDCGNLTSVVSALRERHPASQIIGAGDDDQWTTKPGGEPFNAGRHHMALAAPDDLVFPPFPSDHPQRLTDWNDYHAEHGLDEARKLLIV